MTYINTIDLIKVGGTSQTGKDLGTLIQNTYNILGGNKASVLAHNGTSVAASSNNTSSSIDLSAYEEVIFFAINGNGTNVDFEIQLSHNNTNFDTVAFYSVNLGASTQVSRVIGNSLLYAKIKVTNNDSTNASVVTTGFYGKKTT